MSRPRGSKNKGGGNGDDVPLRVNTVSGEELRVFIDRVEAVDEEIREWTEDRRAIFKEIKGAGYDVATVRSIIKQRAMDPDKRALMYELMLQYTSALGDFAETPLGVAGAERVREENAV